MLVSIDLSLRSTGVCILDSKGTLKGFRLISPSSKEYNDEELLNYITEDILDYLKQFKVSAIVIEGLSFNSFSSEKDKINGNFWHLRCSLRRRYADVLIGIVPVTSWRNWLVSKEVQRAIKVAGDKAGLKKVCVERLPDNVKEAFDDYIKEVKAKKDSIYDLSDAFNLGQYRLSLNK